MVPAFQKSQSNKLIIKLSEGGVCRISSMVPHKNWESGDKLRSRSSIRPYTGNIDPDNLIVNTRVSVVHTVVRGLL